MHYDLAGKVFHSVAPSPSRAMRSQEDSARLDSLARARDACSYVLARVRDA